MAHEEDAFVEAVQRLDQKPRRCLRCQTSFDSLWAGDRICGKCKQTAAWRSNQPARPLANRKAHASGRP